eukprot:TRINITY_DN19593_c0_g1_i1.p1 TRINITY_DN19593_c0_g1~~TRINITY_DN19593_c0_g1_i1.p1  ORF type:complete len:119 (+),score=29.61 TRINITY_DN19593_c0_g1_i1:54-410(+)
MDHLCLDRGFEQHSEIEESCEIEEVVGSDKNSILLQIYDQDKWFVDHPLVAIFISCFCLYSPVLIADCASSSLEHRLSHHGQILSLTLFLQESQTTQQVQQLQQLCISLKDQKMSRRL